jgi:hypothetical protein
MEDEVSYLYVSMFLARFGLRMQLLETGLFLCVNVIKIRFYLLYSR